jgi:hypothetical protein
MNWNLGLILKTTDCTQKVLTAEMRVLVRNIFETERPEKIA